MSEAKQLNRIGHYLRDRLLASKKEASSGKANHFINVAGVGQIVSAAYEQLRNAAEYTQEHLLRQKAIRRFYTRNISFQGKTTVDKSTAEELIVELTQAGYIENDTQPVQVIDDIKNIIKEHYDNYWRLREHGVPDSRAESWTLQLLSAESEKCIAKEAKDIAYAQFAFRYYQATLPKETFQAETTAENNFDACLYVAVHKALLKSDITNVRFDMQQLYQIPDHNISEYAHFHKNIDDIFQADLTDKLTRYVNKYGAPMRVLKSLIDNNKNADELLLDARRFNAAYETQVNIDYEAAKKKVNKGVVKSIIFLLITKTLIGIGIEIPYDILVTGAIVVLPLIINLLVPVVYMAVLRLSLKMPGPANTTAMKQYMNNVLYGDEAQLHLRPTVQKARYSAGFTVVYVLMFIIVFGLVVSWLAAWQFNLVQGVIFFVFLAAASFLGFRLSRIVRELELVTSRPGIVWTLRDFFYMPFILLGQWLSEKYERMNIVALVLDTVIELPLKTVLRLVRQWTSFINEKKDEI